MNSDWVTTRIADVCVDNGIVTGPFGSLLHAEDYVDIGTPLITVKNIKNNFIDSTKIDFVSEEDTNRLKRYTLELDDIVFSRVGNVDQRCLATPEIVGWMISGSCLRLRVDKTKIDPEFLCWLMGHPSFTYLMTSYSVGSTRPSLNTGILSNFEISFPRNLVKQKQLARPLTNLHHIIKMNKVISANLADQIAALFRSWFIDFDPVKAKSEGKSPYGMDEETAALFPNTFVDSELGPIPAGWTIGKIHDIAKQRKDIARPEVFNEMFPYIGLEHMPRNSIALTEWGVSEGLESNKFRYSKKDILFGKLRPYFHKVGPAPLEGVCSTDILVIQPIDEKLGGFLLPILSSEHFVNFVSGISEGVGLPRTKWEHFKLYKIALPPVEIREKFVSLVDPMLQIIESSIHESKGLEHARDALLPRLMSGEIGV